MKTILALLYFLAACATFAGNIPQEVLALSSQTKLKPGQISLLEKTAALDAPEGMLSASILFAHNEEKYRSIFRTRCAYDYEMERIVVPQAELAAKVQEHISRLGKISKLEEDYQTYHFLRRTGYIFRREDGSEFHIEKVFSSASFTGLAMARKEKDAMSFGLRMALESYRKTE